MNFLLISFTTALLCIVIRIILNTIFSKTSKSVKSSDIDKPLEVFELVTAKDKNLDELEAIIVGDDNNPDVDDFKHDNDNAEAKAEAEAWDKFKTVSVAKNVAIDKAEADAIAEAIAEVEAHVKAEAIAAAEVYAAEVYAAEAEVYAAEAAAAAAAAARVDEFRHLVGESALMLNLEAHHVQRASEELRYFRLRYNLKRVQQAVA